MLLDLEKPLVSVVTPTYNASRYVRRAIDSVLAQTYQQIEYFIVDDGSADDTRDIIESTLRSYPEAADRIHYYPNEKNTGFAWHDEIIQKLNGKYICLLAGDDAFNPERIERQVAFMESNPDKFAVCFTWVEVEADDPFIKQGYEELFNVETYSHASCLKQLLDGRNFFNSPSAMINMDVYKLLGGYNYKYRQAQDYGLWVKTLLKYDVAMIPEKLTTYTIHEDSLGALNNQDNLNLFSREREEILTDAFLEIKDELFLELYKEEIQTLIEGVPEEGVSKEDVQCLKVLYLFSLKSFIHDTIATRLYYQYADNKTFNDIMFQRYGYTRSDIHAFIKSTNLYNINPNVDPARMTDELMDILDGKQKAVTSAHISSLYDVCSNMENGQDIFKEIINRLYNAGISFWGK